ncbi:Cornichon family protein [Prunus dulcis]|uniref:Cornichon family protein n=1 Tax=Prunus dulcis TaxID=3755 RepID=A0A5H2XLD6_PRUDU|nr:Cornichon family protein [Prunus dulcis]
MALYVMLTDLEADYINPYELSSRINQLVVPEFVKQQHLIDVTEVFRVLNTEKKCRLVKLDIARASSQLKLAKLEGSIPN